MTVYTLRCYAYNWCWFTLLHTLLYLIYPPIYLLYLSIYIQPSVQSKQHEVSLTYSSRSRVYSRATEWGRQQRELAQLNATSIRTHLIIFNYHNNVKELAKCMERQVVPPHCDFGDG